MKQYTLFILAEDEKYIRRLAEWTERRASTLLLCSGFTSPEELDRLAENLPERCAVLAEEKLWEATSEETKERFTELDAAVCILTEEREPDGTDLTSEEEDAAVGDSDGVVRIFRYQRAENILFALLAEIRRKDTERELAASRIQKPQLLIVYSPSGFPAMETAAAVLAELASEKNQVLLVDLMHASGTRAEEHGGDRGISELLYLRKALGNSSSEDRTETPGVLRDNGAGNADRERNGGNSSVFGESAATAERFLREYTSSVYGSHVLRPASRPEDLWNLPPGDTAEFLEQVSEASGCSLTIAMIRSDRDPLPVFQIADRILIPSLNLAEQRRQSEDFFDYLKKNADRRTMGKCSELVLPLPDRDGEQRPGDRSFLYTDFGMTLRSWYEGS